jgi:DNA-binding MarR family transcriptional regulator
MALIDKARLLAELSPPFDPLLCSQLLDEFISAESRFIQRDWEPAELDGGQFCEILARICYHIDSGILNQSKDFDDCCKYIENDTAKHKYANRRDLLHVVKVIRTVYKFRSQRGAVHISPSYGPNHMDSKLVIECVRWAMNETIRLFWKGSDREAVAKAIRELLQFDVPCVGVFDGTLLVQRTDVTTDEEILVLLHFAGEQGFTRTEIGRYARRDPSSVTKALQRLVSIRQVVVLATTRYRLTDLGSKRIREQLTDKLLLS